MSDLHLKPSILHTEPKHLFNMYVKVKKSKKKLGKLVHEANSVTADKKY